MNAKMISALISVTILALLAGFMISIQINTQDLYSSDLSAQNTETLVAIIRESNEKRIELERQYLATSESVESMAVQNLTVAKALEQLTEENESISIMTGASEVTGAGISIRLNNCDKLVGTDLLDIVNELWGTGAEVIAVNGVRVTNTSSFGNAAKDGEIELTLNGQTLTRPITIYAIGNGENLETGLTFPGGIADSLKASFGIEVSITQENSLTLPAVVTE